MTGFSRVLTNQLAQRLAEPSPLIQVLIGPRQVGKTTAIQQVLNGRGIYFTADSPAPLDAHEVEKVWELALNSADGILAIDEVQKIRGWAEILKKLWDTRPKSIKIILSGSAALTIEKDLKESLAGRYELFRAEHWNLKEAQAVFGLTEAQFVEFGCYPGAVRFLQDRQRWSAYIRDSIVEPAIGRDILQLQPVDNPALLRQLFGICVGHPAQVVSLHKLQGQLQDRGALATLQKYLELLSFGFLTTGLQKYTANAIRTRQSPPKLIVHDNGLIRAFERPVEEPLSADRLGRYIENAVGARFIEAGWDVFYWQDRNLEVDFVVLGPRGERWAIEVKSTPPAIAELKGLLTFCRNHPEFKPFVVCPDKVNLEGIQHLFLSQILGLSRINSFS